MHCNCCERCNWRRNKMSQNVGLVVTQFRSSLVRRAQFVVQSKRGWTTKFRKMSHYRLGGWRAGAVWVGQCVITQMVPSIITQRTRYLKCVQLFCQTFAILAVCLDLWFCFGCRTVPQTVLAWRLVLPGRSGSVLTWCTCGDVHTWPRHVTSLASR